MANTNTPVPGHPVMAFYQEVVRGDLKKYLNQSNKSASGGGARDLRISPVSEFWNDLKGFFPVEVSGREYKGNVLTQGDGQTVEQVPITLMGPTGARKNECRICTISLIKGWNITEEEFNKEESEGYNWFFFLILDDKQQVWASKFSSRYLDEMHNNVKRPIKIALQRTKSNTIRNIVKL